MSYPNGPYGQGFPGQPPGYQQQPAYPQQPANYQGYPQQPGYPGGYPPQQPPAPPSSTTGIFAGVLAGLGAVANLGGGLLGLIGLIAVSGDSTFRSSSALSGGVFALLIIVTLLGVACGLILLAGSVMLLQRKMTGRWLVIGGCALTIVGSLVNLGVNAAVTAGYEYYGGNGFAVLGLIFPVATIVLTLLPSTTAWIQAKPNPVTAPYYPPYQG